jgi:hypothetical protein
MNLRGSPTWAIVLGLSSACTVDGRGEDGLPLTMAETDSATEGDVSSDGSESSASSTSAGTSDTGSSTDGFGASARCLSAVPEGWRGPIAVFSGDPGGEEAPDCGGDYASRGLAFLQGYGDPGPAQCDCSCRVNYASLCSSLMYEYGNSCGSFVMSHQLAGPDCHQVGTDGGAYFYMYQQGTPTCQSQRTVELPEPGWDAMISSCGGAEQGAACDGGGVCTPNAPEGYDAGLCIYQQGDHECPAGDFSTKVTLHSGVEDTRNCSTCTCGTGTASCTGTLDVFASNDCSGDPITSVTQNTGCDDTAVGVESVQIAFTEESSCPVEVMPEPTGEIAATGVFTYCCEAG